MSSISYFSKIFSDAFAPIKTTQKSVGFDLMSYEETDVNPMGIALIRTGIKVQPSDGTYLRLASRSGLALRGISVQGGVIDSD